MRKTAFFIAFIALAALAGADRSTFFEAYDDGSGLLIAVLDGCDSNAVFWQETRFTDEGIEVTKKALFETSTVTNPKAVIIPSGGVAEAYFEFNEGKATAKSFALTNDSAFMEMQLKPFKELPPIEKFEVDVDCEASRTATIKLFFPEHSLDSGGLVSFAWASVTHLDVSELALKRQFLYDENDLQGYFSLPLTREEDPSPFPGLQQEQLALNRAVVRLPSHLYLERANMEHSSAYGKMYYWDNVTGLALTLKRDFGDWLDPNNLMLAGGLFGLVAIIVLLATQLIMTPLAILKKDSGRDEEPEEDDSEPVKEEPSSGAEEALKELEELERDRNSGKGQND